MTPRRIITAREQLEMLSPWREIAPLRVGFIKEARYPQEWRGEAPYGYLPSGRARNRPPSVRSDPDDPNSEIIDPSEIRYVKHDYDDAVSAYHPNGDHIGKYSWENGEYGDPPHISTAQVHPAYQGQGVAGAIIDHIRENYQPDLVHSGYQGNGSLSYQGRAGALRDLGNTEEEHNDYFNTTPYNYGDNYPAGFGTLGRDITEAQRQAHKELMTHFEEDKKHPNYTGVRSGRNSDMYDDYGSPHEYGYDTDGNYVGLQNGTKDYEGYSEEGYDSEGYNREGYNRENLDRDGRDEYGFSGQTGLNQDGQTRHGYTPGDGTPPEGTVPMSQMSAHWAQHGLPTSGDHQRMMDGASGRADAYGMRFSPTMYAVRNPGEVSSESGTHHVGNGDTLYSSLDRARQVAYHPDDPSKDKNIVSVKNLNPDWLHTDATGSTPHDFHYAPDSSGLQGNDVEDTASTEANLIHDPYRHQRILGDLGHGWSQSTEPPLSTNSGFEYTHPDSGRAGRMYQQGNNGQWRTEHQPEFGRLQRDTYSNYRAAADAIHRGTAPGPTLDQHALEVNNNYEATGGGEVDWEPHPSGQGLTARTPHGDLHLTRDTDNGWWNWHAGPHGSQPGDMGNLRGPLSDTLNRAAASGVRAITRSPFHGGLGDQLGEGWVPHPTSVGTYTRRLPSGNHAFVRPDQELGYTSGIQRENSSGQPYGPPMASRSSSDLDQAKAFIEHRENAVPASALGKGWQEWNRGPRHFPSYIHENHPSGAEATVSWSPHQNSWRSMVHHQGKTHLSEDTGLTHDTPQDAASWANSFMDNIR